MEAKEVMELTLILILAGMLIGVGVLTLDKFSAAVYDSHTVTNETIVWPANTTTVNLTYGNVSALIDIFNASGDTIPSTHYNFSADYGMFTAWDNTSYAADGDNVGVTYTWMDFDSQAALALEGGRDATSGIATTWLSLIVTIAVLAIIMTLVIQGFGARE